jgi:hypothetical protein
VTEAELQMVRISANLEAIRTLLRGLYTGLANTSPNAAQVIREKFAALRTEQQKVTLRGVDPAMSDLVAAEFQEALDDLLTFIESGFKA